MIRCGLSLGVLGAVFAAGAGDPLGVAAFAGATAFLAVCARLSGAFAR